MLQLKEVEEKRSINFQSELVSKHELLVLKLKVGKDHLLRISV